jgi:metallo-beta-lactamase class B
MKSLQTHLFAVFFSIALLVGCKAVSDEVSEAEPESLAKARLSELPDALTSSELFDTTILKPTQLFDNFYFVGFVSVGSFVIQTSDGILLIDSMWTPKDAQTVIVPGMIELGLDPKDIKFVLITHGHSDHYGGAHYFEKEYGAKILMREQEWRFIHNPEAPVLTDPFGNYSTEIPTPTTYTPVADKDILNFGDTQVTILATPGHTPGATSLIISAKDGGKKHTVALWGGTGLPDTLEANKRYLQSLNYFQTVVNEKGADVTISNHPFSNNLIEKMKLLNQQETSIPNPVVVGNEAINDYIDNELRNNVKEKISSFD